LLVVAGAFFASATQSAAGARPGMMPITPLGGIVPVPVPQPFANRAGAHLTYYGGPVMAFTENAIVLWGGSGHASSLTSDLPGFFTSFADAGNANTYNAALEYGTQGLAGTTTNQPLTLASRYLGSFTISPSTSSTNLSDAQVASELIAQIGAGALPPPRVAFGGPVTEYYVMFPPTYRICLGSSCSDAQFCAYHSDAAYAGTPFTYTVLPESTPTSSGCGASSGGDGFGNLTAMTSHELVESMTDPEVGSAPGLLPPLAWYDGINGEIGDICNGQQATLTLGASSWTVQKQWSNAETACIVSHVSSGLKGVSAEFSPVAASGAPTGFDASATTSPNGSGLIATYSWDWGDGTSSTGPAPLASHAYATPGRRPVTLVATDADGASGARFATVTTQNLTVSTVGSGQVTSAPGGLSCGGACSANFLDGAAVSLTATPSPEAAFVSWTGDCAGEPATCTVTMTAARAETAIFTSASPPPPSAPAPADLCVVPSLKSRMLAGARTILQTAHCSAGAITRRYSRALSKGRVISQGAVPGTHLPSGAAISLVVSRGRAPATRVTLCYRSRTVHVTKAVARKLRSNGATIGICRKRATRR
jgi:hypothetical protein